MIRINQLKLEPDHSEEDLQRCVAKLLGVKTSEFKDSLKIIRRSLDARKKPDIKYVYSVELSLPNEDKILKRVHNSNVVKCENTEYGFNFGKKEANIPPVVTGSGPAGLFCALMLARAGLKPLVIERGEAVEDRVKRVDTFFATGELNEESNVQFGEGGAGTFSDGKLNTMVKDPYGRIKYVLETFVRYGAKNEILYVNKPHIGTDILRNIVRNMREEIVELGGTFRFNTKLTDIVVRNDHITHIILNETEKLECNCLALAIGHSARDTFSMIRKKGIDMNAKAFAVGVRIEHPQEIINANAYGDVTKYHLPAADYKVAHQCANGRGVYSFCMCPGGYVVNASSEKGRLAVNGMSYSGRDGKNANSALIVTVNPSDFGSDDILAGIAFQRQLEEAAYSMGKGDIPIQRYEDFSAGRISKEFGRVLPASKGKNTFGNVRDIFPEYINNALLEGIESFGRIIPGFSTGDALISGVESRTSSPVRILRNDNTFESNIGGIYPCGEGAGYAGGITSAAVDGIKTAEKIYQHF